VKYKTYEFEYTEEELDQMIASSGLKTRKDLFDMAEKKMFEMQRDGKVVVFQNALKLVSDFPSIHNAKPTEKVVPRGVDIEPPTLKVEVKEICNTDIREDFAFAPAKKTDTHMKIALFGSSGSGKTYSGLLLANTLAQGKKIAVIDTEDNSAALYTKLAKFDTLILRPPYSPDRYTQAIKMAEQAGYGVLLIDSATHLWTGSGGMLEMVDRTNATSNDKRAGWKYATPKYEAFLEAVKNAKMHVICTVRTKTKLLETEDEHGSKKFKKSNDEPIMRDGIEYEFTTVLDIDITHLAKASKDRTGIFDTVLPEYITEETGKLFLKWLGEK
jgi:hypothetical protein